MTKQTRYNLFITKRRVRPWVYVKYAVVSYCELTTIFRTDCKAPNVGQPRTVPCRLRHGIFALGRANRKAGAKLKRGEQIRTVRAAKTRARIPAGVGFVTLNLVHAIIAFRYVAQGTRGRS